MWPPVIANSRANASKSSAGSTGVAAGSTARHSSMRCASSGSGKRMWTARALKRGIDRGLVIRGEQRDSGELLDPLEQVVDLEVRVAVI